MNKKNQFKLDNLAKFLLFSIFFFHLIGIIVAFLRIDIPFQYHLLRFFAWWSVHTSIFTILAVVFLFRESKKVSYFSQFMVYLATMYNLITFVFWTYCLLFASVRWEKSSLLNIQNCTWHLVAPPLTIFYFYLYGQVDKLSKKLIKTLLLTLISPVFYFFYVWILAKINYGEKSSLFPYLKKYPYPIFAWIAERKWNCFIINFLIALGVFIFLCFLVFWTKYIYDKKRKKFKRLN